MQFRRALAFRVREAAYGALCRPSGLSAPARPQILPVSYAYYAKTIVLYDHRANGPSAVLTLGPLDFRSPKTLSGTSRSVE
jgi:hypothetical protein